MDERRLEVEVPLRVSGRELIPIAWTIERTVMRRHGVMVAMCREAFGVIIRDDAGLRVLLVDGRDISADELLAEHPSLADAVAALRRPAE